MMAHFPDPEDILTTIIVCGIIACAVFLALRIPVGH